MCAVETLQGNRPGVGFVCVRAREHSPAEHKSTAWTGSPQSSAGSAPGTASQTGTIRITTTHQTDLSISNCNYSNFNAWNQMNEPSEMRDTVQDIL